MKARRKTGDLSANFYATRAKYELRLAASVWLQPSECPTGTALDRSKISPELRLLLSLATLAMSADHMTRLVYQDVPRDYWIAVLRCIVFDHHLDAHLTGYYADRLAQGIAIEEAHVEQLKKIRAQDQDYY